MGYRRYIKTLFSTHTILLQRAWRDDSNYTLKDLKKNRNWLGVLFEVNYDLIWWSFKVYDKQQQQLKESSDELQQQDEQQLEPRRSCRIPKKNRRFIELWRASQGRNESRGSSHYSALVHGRKESSFIQQINASYVAGVILILCSRASILGKLLFQFLYLNSAMRQRTHAFNIQ
jgi:hypothetical protein